MRTRLQLTGMSLLVGAAMLLNTGSAFAAAATATLGLDVTFNGLVQNTGITLAAPASVGGTVLTVTDSRPFKPGQYLELNDGTANWEVLRVVSKTGDGPGGLTDTLTVGRALKGTAQSNYTSGTALYAEFNRIGVNVAGIAPRTTGAQLAAPLDTGLFDPSGALLTEAVNSSATQLKVSDARLTPNAVAGIGGQVKIDSEIMNVSNVSFGEVLNSGATLQEDVLFTSKTTLNISDKTKLQVGWPARVPADFGEPEEMLIIGLNGDGAGGAQDTMTVVRGNIGSLLHGTPIYAGQDTITVTRGSSPVSHAAAAPVSTNARIAHVNDSSLVTSGSHVAIDTEAMVVLQTPSKHFHTSGATLATAAGAPDTLLRVSSAPALATGDIISIDSEEMVVLRSTPGCTVGAASTLAAIDSAQTVVGINDRTKLSLACAIKMGSEEMLVIALAPPAPCTVGAGAVTQGPMPLVSSDGATPTTVNINNETLLALGCTITVDSEQMLVTALDGDGAGGVQDTMIVQRAYGTAPASHLTNKAITAGALIDTMTIQRAYNDTTAAAHSASSIATTLAAARVTRPLYATTAAAHGSGAVIKELTPETNTISLGRPPCSAAGGAATLDAMDGAQTTVNINNRNLLIVGCSVRIDSEEMMVIGLSGDGAGGGTDTMTVQRAYYGTTAAAHVPATIVQDTPASHLSGAPITDIDGLGAYTVGTASSAATTVSTIAALVNANTAETTIAGTNSAALPSSPACSIGGAGAATLAAMDNVQTTVNINNRSVLSVGCTVRMQNEDMLVTGLSGDGANPPGTLTDTMTVQRAYNGTPAATHAVGAMMPGTPPGWVIIVDNEKMRIQSVNVGAGTMTVARAVNGTSVASHDIGAAIRGPVMLEYSYGSNATLLGSTGRPVDCTLQPTTLQLEGATAGCATQLNAFGATGSGTLSYVELWGPQLMPKTPPQNVTITPSLLDGTGDAIPAAGSGTQVIKVEKCGDVNGNGIFNASDTTLALRAFFGIDPVNLATMDISMDGILTVASDVVLARRVLFLSQPGGSLRCLPNVP